MVGRHRRDQPPGDVGPHHRARLRGRRGHGDPAARVVGLPQRPHRRAKDRSRWGAMLLVVFCGLASGAAAFGVVDKGSLVDVGTIELRAGLAAARQGDAAGAAAHLEAARVALAGARHGVEQWGTAARFVPITAQHVGAVSAVLADVEQAASFAAQAAAIADDRLAVTAGTVDVEAIAELSGPLTRLVTAFEEVVREIDRRADDPLLPALSDRLERLRVESSRAHRDAAAGAEAAERCPTCSAPRGRGATSSCSRRPPRPAGASASRARSPRSPSTTADTASASTAAPASSSPAPPTTRATSTSARSSCARTSPYGSTRTVLSSTISPDFPTVAEVLGRDVGAVGPQAGRRRRPLRPLVDRPAHDVHRARVGERPRRSAHRRQRRAVPPRRPVRAVLGVADPGPPPRGPRRGGRDDLRAARDRRPAAAPRAHRRVPHRRRRPAPPGRALRRRTSRRSSARSASTARSRTRRSTAWSSPPSTASGTRSTPSWTGPSPTAVRSTRNRVDATLEVTLGNEAPASGLPDYVIGSFSQPPPPKGTNRMTLLVYTAVPGRVRGHGSVGAAPPERPIRRMVAARDRGQPPVRRHHHGVPPPGGRGGRRARTSWCSSRAGGPARTAPRSI